MDGRFVGEVEMSNEVQSLTQNMGPMKLLFKVNDTTDVLGEDIGQRISGGRNVILLRW